MELFHIKNFSCHVTLLLKRKLQHVGHIRIVLWVSGSNESSGVTHFQPWLAGIAQWKLKIHGLEPDYIT